jgi:Ca2+-binding EF-hand superfamily protein
MQKKDGPQRFGTKKIVAAERRATRQKDNQGMIRQLFEKYDGDNNGSINDKELQRLCADMGYYLKNEEAQIAVQMLDSNGDGSIGYEEFLQWWRTEDRFSGLQLSPEDMQKLQVIRNDFSKYHRTIAKARYDKDNSGRIDSHEFKYLHADLVKRDLTGRNLIDTLQVLELGYIRSSIPIEMARSLLMST